MKRLILTNNSSAAGGLGAARLANFRISLERQLVWGRLPSDAELSGFLGRAGNVSRSSIGRTISRNTASRASAPWALD